MDNPPTAPNERPPVPVGAHRRRRRRKHVWWWTAWALIVASVLPAIFVHKGLLGIAGLVSAVVVAYVMLQPRQWGQPDEDDEVTEDSPG